MYDFTPPCLDTTLSLPELGLTAIGQHHTGRHLTVLCLITDNDRSCPVCRRRGLVRATRIRKLVHPPIGLTAVTLAIRIRTYTCPSCHQRWSQTLQRACEYLKLWGPPDRAVGDHRYCLWGPAAVDLGATGRPSAHRHGFKAACSLML